MKRWGLSRLEPGETYLLDLDRNPDTKGYWVRVPLYPALGAHPLRVDPRATGDSEGAVLLSSARLGLASGMPRPMEQGVKLLVALATRWPAEEERPISPAEVVEQLVALLPHEHGMVNNAAIYGLGARGPVSGGPSWIVPYRRPAGVPVARAPDRVGHGLMPGPEHFEALADAADQLPAPQRAQLIRALWAACVDQADRIATWRESDEPAVRASGTLLTATLAGGVRTAALREATSDPEPEVRVAAANAIALSSDTALVAELERLLPDPSPEVQTAAALALIALGPAATDGAFERHVDHPVYGGLFVVGLAGEEAKPWRDRLAELVRTRYRPEGVGVGSQASAYAWQQLFDDLSALPSEQLAAPEAAPLLDALESADFQGSTEPLSLYELYRTHGLDPRADAFRAHCDATMPFDLTQSFDHVDGRVRAAAADPR